jgi:hypothetical protein
MQFFFSVFGHTKERTVKGDHRPTLTAGGLGKKQKYKPETQ